MRYLSLSYILLFLSLVQAQEDIRVWQNKMEEFNSTSPDSSLRFCNLIINHYHNEENITKEAFYQNRKGVLLKRKSKYKQAENAYTKSLKLSTQALDKKGEGIALNNLGEIHLLQGEYSEAIELHQKTLNLKQELKDTFGIGSSYLNLGNVFLYQSQYSEALHNYVRASDMFSIIKDSLRLSSVYNNLGALHNYINNHDKALEYWEQSLVIKKQIGDQSAIAKALNNLAEIYMADGDLDAALQYLEESLIIKQENKDKEGFLVTTYNLGECLRLRKEYSKALPYFHKAQSLLSSMPVSNHHAELNNKLGLYHLELNQLAKAEKHFLLSQDQAQTLGAKEISLSVSDNLALTYEMQGKYKKALSAKSRFVLLKDSIQSQAQNDKILELESQYEVKNKTQQIEILQSKNTIATLQQDRSSQRNKYLLGGLGILSILSLILFRNSRLKKRYNTLLKEKNDLIEQDLLNKNVIINEIHHRIKNNLAIIDSLINVQLLADKDASPEAMLRNAQNRIKSISTLHDLLYQNQIAQELSLPNYLQEICTHVMKSYGDLTSAISLETTFDKIDLQESHYIKVGLITNELLTNAIKHGFPTNRSGQIYLSLHSQDDKTAILSIQHSGNQAKRNSVLNSKGLGVQLIRGLANQIKGDFKISDENSIKFTVTFPCERTT